MKACVATESDLDGIAETLTSASEADPLWGWAFPEREGLEAWWRFFAGSALRYPWTWIADDFAAVAVWIPPGGIELAEAEEAAPEPLLADLLGPRAPEVLELVESFDANHPKGRPHYYLSLLGGFGRPDGHGTASTMWREARQL